MLEPLNTAKVYATGFLKRPFVRNVATVATGSTASQFIALLFIPVLTRIYSPEAFGILGVFIATTALVNTVGSLTYQIAIVLPEREKEAKALVVLSVIIVALISGLTGLALYFLGDQIVGLLQIETIQSYLFLIPLYVFFAGLHKIAEQWIIRKEQFKKKAITGVVNITIANTAKLGFGLFHPVALVMITVTVCSQLIHSVMLSLNYSKGIGMMHTGLKNVLSTFKKMNLQDMRHVMNKYNDFPLYRAPQAFIDALSQQTPALILAAFFGPAAAGFYAIGKKAIQKPASLISSSVGKVFYPTIAKAWNNKQNIQSIVIRSSAILALVGIIPFGAIFLIAPYLFEFVFGAEWGTAGEYARWLAVWLYFDFVRIVSIQTIPVIGIQGFFLVYTMFSTPIRVGAFILAAVLLGSDIGSLAVFCITSALLSLGLILFVLYKSGKVKY